MFYVKILTHSGSSQKLGNLGSTILRRSEEHTSELQSRQYLVCRLLLEKKNVALTVGVFLLLFGAGLWAFTRMGHRFAMVERGVGLVKKKRRIAFSVFFFNDTATTEIYTLSLHDALPICEWYKELIFVDSFVRHGYHRNAKIEDDI